MSDEEERVEQAIAALKEVPKTKRQAVLEASNGSSIQDVDPETKRGIWFGIFAVLGIALVGALLLILRSFSVEITTVTGSGNMRVTSITHPDVSAAWALASSVVAGVVGLLAPSPVKNTGHDSE